MTAHPKPTIPSDAPDCDPVSRFTAAMAAFGPFERSPHLAVAVSGGPDSMALALLARDWAAARGGRVTALIVDHGLRAESGGEARIVASRLQDLGMSAEVLAWTGAKPSTGIQAAARAARYGLLRDWCRAVGVLHLLTGHQADDQAETQAMRRARAVAAGDHGPGLGLAGMSAVREFSEVRLLRPLLGERRAGLQSFLAARGIAWVDDPSNLDPRFERVRQRQGRAPGEVSGLDAQAAAQRLETEARVNAALAQVVSLSPWGWATLDRSLFGGLEPVTRHHLLARLVSTVGGADHSPPSGRTARLAERLADDADFAGASLGRCRIDAARQGKFQVFRASRDLPASVAARPGRLENWDGRFCVDLPDHLPAGSRLAPLGAEGWRQISRDRRRASGLVLAAARTLPALFSGEDLVGYILPEGSEKWEEGPKIRFRPKNTLGFNGFCIA